MTADHAHIIALAEEITANRRPKSVLTPARLGEFMSVDLGDVLVALGEAPAHVQRAFGVVDAPAGRAAAFRLPR